MPNIYINQCRLVVNCAMGSKLSNYKNFIFENAVCYMAANLFRTPCVIWRYCWLSGKQWHIPHNCVGDTIVYHGDSDIYFSWWEMSYMSPYSLCYWKFSWLLLTVALMQCELLFGRFSGKVSLNPTKSRCASELPTVYAGVYQLDMYLIQLIVESKYTVTIWKISCQN